MSCKSIFRAYFRQTALRSWSILENASSSSTSLTLEGAVQQDDCAGMDASEQFLEGFFLRRLFVLIPVYVGEAPEKGIITELFYTQSTFCIRD